jgi:putative FmdB family regulatory protein
MPLYSYQCLGCGKEFDEFYKIHDCPQDRRCNDLKCPGTAIKVVSLKSAVHGDTPSWLDDHVQGALMDIDSKNFRPIESRSELKKYMKREGICESPRSGPRWI